MEMSHPCRLFILLQNSTGCGQSLNDGEKIRAFNNYTANTTSRPIPRLPLTDRLPYTDNHPGSVYTHRESGAGTPEIPGVLHTRTPHTMTPPV